jgi:hypothetical protein
VRRRGTAIVVAALCMAACAPATPTPSSGAVQGARYPVACVDLPAAECEAVRAAADARFDPTLGIAAMSVEGFLCPQERPGCPDGLAVRGEGGPLVETADGRLWRVPVTVAAGVPLDGEPVEIPSVRLIPSSVRAVGPVVQFALGHWGLASPVDVDGSLWDPIGPVDGDHPSFINSADGHLRFAGPARAEFRTRDGFVVALTRRPGAKSYALCD